MIKFSSVTKTYPDGTVALADINLEIDKGEFVVLTGPSGSGKTTLIKLLIHEETPTWGEISFDDWDIVNLPRGQSRELRRRIGVVFQDFKLLPTKNAFENVAFPLEAAGKAREEVCEIVPEILKMVHLESRSHLFPTQMSGGEKQRLAIARALCFRPEVFIADEPTGMLDAKATEELCDIFNKINDLGTTVILATHNEGLVKRFGKRVTRLDRGRIVGDHKKS